MATTSGTLSIGEVADRTGVSPSALRFYETEGLITSSRSDGGQRRYPREVLRRVAFVRVAQRVGLSLDEIRASLATLPQGRTPTKADWQRLSNRWRPRLDEQIAMLVALRDELASCIGCGCLSLQACSLYNREDAARTLGQGPRYLLGDTSAEALLRVAEDEGEGRVVMDASPLRRSVPPAGSPSPTRRSAPTRAPRPRPSSS